MTVEEGRGRSLRDYDHRRYGPFLGVSDEGSAADAIRDAARDSPKARALADHDPFTLGVAHDAERLGSVGEVPVGPDELSQISRAAAGRVLMTTNVGSHVNLWHYLQPPALDVSAEVGGDEIAEWARSHGSGLLDRDPQPWLRIRFPGVRDRSERVALLGAAAAEAPVCMSVRAEHGAGAAREAIGVAAAAGAAAVVVDGAARPPTEGRPALPGLLNYFDAAETRRLLRAARQHEVEIEPALKIDTRSVANQIWTGLHAVRECGLHLGKYGLFPLTFQELAHVVERIQRWMADWTAAPAFYVDVPWVDGDRVYDVADAFEASSRWLALVAGHGARVVLIDTVDKWRGRHLVRDGADDDAGIFWWEEIDALEKIAAEADVRVLWAGGIPPGQIRAFGSRRVFGVYVTSAVSESRPLTPEEEQDIGLTTAKEPVRQKIALVKLMLEAGFIGDSSLDADAAAAESGDADAAGRLAAALTKSWAQRLGASSR